MLKDSVEGAKQRLIQLENLHTDLQSWLEEFASLYQDAESLGMKKEFLQEVIEFISETTNGLLKVDSCGCHIDYLSTTKKISAIKEHFKNLCGFKPNSRPSKSKVIASIEVLLLQYQVKYGESSVEIDICIEKIKILDVKDQEFWLAVGDLMRILADKERERLTDKEQDLKPEQVSQK